MQLQASIANSQSQGAMFGAGIGLIGGLFCDRRMKTDIEPAGVEIAPGIPLYTFRFKDEGDDAPIRVGPMAQDVDRIYPEAVGERDGWLTVDMDKLNELIAGRRSHLRLVSER
jgi:hypothetical protein